MRLSHWFPSQLVGIGLGFREFQITTKLILDWEFPDPPYQVRKPMGKCHMAISHLLASREFSRDGTLIKEAL